MRSSSSMGMIRGLKLSNSLHWALVNKLVIALTLMISVCLLQLVFRPFRAEELSAMLSAPSGLLCRNNSSSTTDEKLLSGGGDGKHGGIVDVVDSALETNGQPKIRFYKTQTVPAFQMFVCENCKCGLVCSQTMRLGYFAPIETSIFRHILGNGGCDGAPLVVDVGANVGYFSAYATALGCRVASFEPNQHPRRYLEASAALHDPQHLTWKVYPVAIGKEEKKMHFREEWSWGLSHITTNRKLMQQVQELEVEMVLLDTIVKEDVLLLKIDTEGYEESVIDGSRNVLKNYNVKNVVVEVKNFNAHHVRDFLFELKEVGGFTHVYNYLEEYNKQLDLSTFELQNATMWDVTDVVMNERYEQELKEEDFWFCKEENPKP